MIENPPPGRLAAALGAAVLIAACGDGSGPTPPLTGTYSLRTIGGHTLPTSYTCISNISGGSLAITSDSVLLQLSIGQGADASTAEWHRAYAPTTDGKQIVVAHEGSDLRDTATVVGGGRVTYRGWIPVSAATCGTSVVHADLGFTHD